MTQQEHLTTEQLSAFLDKQLTPQEQAFFDAHMQSCQRCQNALGELRRTVALLHALPQPSLPRSFTLPASTTQAPAARPQPVPIQQRRVLRYTMQRAVRAVSTLAAVAAVVFILSGLLAGLHFSGGGASMTAAPANGTYSNSNSNGATHNAAGPNVTQAPQATSSTPAMSTHQAGTKTPTRSPAATPKARASSDATATPTDGVNNGTTPTAPPPTLPPFLDIGQAEGRLALGGLLLLLSIVGLIATRHRRNAAT